MDGVVPDRTLRALRGRRLNGSITSNLQIPLIGFYPSQIALDVIMELSCHSLRFFRMRKKIDHRLRESMFVADIYHSTRNLIGNEFNRADRPSTNHGQSSRTRLYYRQGMTFPMRG